MYKISIFILIACVCLGGCVELKYSAKNRLDDAVAIQSARPVKSVYFSLRPKGKRDKDFAELFTPIFTDACSKKGLAIESQQSSADISIDAKVRLTRKADGTFLFVLFFPVYRFTEDYDGIDMRVSFNTDRGRWRKNYRAYFRSWLVDDRDTAIARVVDAILGDIPLEAQ